jgi:hypothetical protein
VVGEDVGVAFCGGHWVAPVSPCPPRDGRRVVGRRERVAMMETVHVRCAGLDIAKKDAKVCVRVAGAGRRKTVETVSTWGATTNQVFALREHLVAEQVTCAVMEATGDYWKPFYYLLEDAGFEVQLVNARYVKNLPGRKTDLSRMRRGWPSSVPMAWSGGRSCHLRRSDS